MNYIIEARKGNNRKANTINSDRHRTQSSTVSSLRRTLPSPAQSARQPITTPGGGGAIIGWELFRQHRFIAETAPQLPHSPRLTLPHCAAVYFDPGDRIESFSHTSDTCLCLEQLPHFTVMSSEGLFRTQYVQGVYIPSALLIFGTAIMKSEWVPYAVGLAAILGGWKVYSNGKNHCPFPTPRPVV